MLRRLLYAWRSLRHAPWFALGALATFALGIGINLGVFWSVDRILFRPLPYDNPERLFLLQQIDRDTGARVPFLPAKFVAEARGGLSFLEDLATLGDSSGYFMTPDLEEPEIRLSNVTWRMLDVGGVRPILGRGFVASDEGADPKPVVLTYEGWRARFGGDPSAIGRKIWWRQETLEVIGVLPPGYIASGAFVDPLIAGLTVMREPSSVVNGTLRTVPPTVRVRRGVTRQAAQAELDAFARAYAGREGLADRGPRFELLPIRDAMFGQYRAYVSLVLAGGALVLGTACLNLGVLFLARGRSRSRDVAVRAALGATRRHLLLENLAECLIVCGAGTLVSLLALQLTAPALASVLPPVFGRFTTGGVDLRLAVMAMAITVLASLAAAAAPMSGQSRVDGAGLVAAGMREAGSHRRWQRSTLVAAEAMLGVVLVAGAFASMRSFARLTSSPLGFDPVDVYTLNAQMPRDTMERREETDRILQTLRLEPEVLAAGAAPQPSVLRAGTLPFSNAGPSCCRWRVSAGYFEAVGLRAIAGRIFTGEDVVSRPDVAILSVQGVATVWPGLDPAAAVGRRLTFEGEFAREVIGVVPDTRRSYDDAPQPSIYVPLTGDGAGLMVVRVRPGARLTPRRMREIIEREGHATYVYLRPMAPTFDRTLQAPRFRAFLFSIFAGVALLVVIVGIYAVAMFDVASRRRELAVRLALGASRGQLIRQALVEACAPVFAGALAGLGVAYWAGQFVQGFLVNVDARDPGSLAIVALGLLGVAAIAALAPALRAAATEPARELRV